MNEYNKHILKINSLLQNNKQYQPLENIDEYYIHHIDMPFISNKTPLLSDYY